MITFIIILVATKIMCRCVISLLLPALEMNQWNTVAKQAYFDKLKRNSQFSKKPAEKNWKIRPRHMARREKWYYDLKVGQIFNKFANCF